MSWSAHRRCDVTTAGERSCQAGTARRRRGRQPAVRTDAEKAAVTATTGSPDGRAVNARASRVPSLLLGLGSGGFIDGIVLHQILQWHHMVSATEGNPTVTVEGLQANTLGDGMFHVATLILVASGMFGVLRTWRQGRRAPPPLFHIGLLLMGWKSSTSSKGSSTITCRRSPRP